MTWQSPTPELNCDSCMGEELKRLLERIRGFSPAEVAAVRGFLAGWSEFKSCFQPGFPEDKLWVNFVANHEEWVRPLGVTVNPRHHWPFVQLRCPSGCLRCDRPASEEQQIREAVEREEAERARAQEERALKEVEELQRRDRLTEALGRQSEQKDEAVKSKRQLRKKEEKRIAEAEEQFRKQVEKNPRLGEVLDRTQRFVEGWPRYVDEHPGVPEAKLWLAYIANDPRGAAGFGAAVNPAEHLPRVVNGCLTPCRLCDEVEPLEARRRVWARTQQLVEEANRAREQREREAAEEAARAREEAAARKRQRKKEARRRRKEEAELALVTPEAGAGEQAAESTRWVRELFAGREEELRRLVERVEARESAPHRSIDDLD